MQYKWSLLNKNQLDKQENFDFYNKNIDFTANHTNQ